MTKYNPINDEVKLREEINQLDKLAKSYLCKLAGPIYIEDLYFMAVIDKSIKLIDTFLYAMENRNITVLAMFTRVQIDCVPHPLRRGNRRHAGDTTTWNGSHRRRRGGRRGACP